MTRTPRHRRSHVLDLCAVPQVGPWLSWSLQISGVRWAVGLALVKSPATPGAAASVASRRKRYRAERQGHPINPAHDGFLITRCSTNRRAVAVKCCGTAR